MKTEDEEKILTRNKRDEEAHQYFDAEKFPQLCEAMELAIAEARKDGFTWCEIGYWFNQFLGDCMYDVEIEETIIEGE